MMKDLKEVFPKSRREWRSWLKKNHATHKHIWLVLPKRNSSVSTLTVAEAVEEALCFGWIDSRANKVDEKKFKMIMSQRNPKSKWSAINKARVKKLIKSGLMTPAGMNVIESAKKSGAWTALDKIYRLEYPEDFSSALKMDSAALKNFEAFPPSAKRAILAWIQDAKKADTRTARISKTVALASENIRANQWSPKK